MLLGVSSSMLKGDTCWEATTMTSGKLSAFLVSHLFEDARSGTLETQDLTLEEAQAIYQTQEEIFLEDEKNKDSKTSSTSSANKSSGGGGGASYSSSSASKVGGKEEKYSDSFW